MQRIKQLTSGALFIALSTTGFAFAGEEGKDQHAKDRQGGRSSEPAARTGSAAERQAPGAEQSTGEGSEQSASNPKPAGDTRAAQAEQSSGANNASGARLTSAQIRQIQRELTTRGMYQGTADGTWGPQTTAALRQFQQQQGLEPTGRVDAPTRDALNLQLERQPVSGAQTSASPELQPQVGREGTQGATGTRPSESQVPLQAMTPQQLRLLQTHLQQYGFYRGQVNGTMGEQTRSALQRFFQTQAELASRGVLSEMTSPIFGLPSRELDPAMETDAAQGRSGQNSQSPSTRQGVGPWSSGAAGQQNQPSTRGQPNEHGQPSQGQPSRHGQPSPSGSSQPSPSQQNPSQQNPSQPGTRSPQPGGGTP